VPTIRFDEYQTGATEVGDGNYRQKVTHSHFFVTELIGLGCSFIL